MAAVLFVMGLVWRSEVLELLSWLVSGKHLLLTLIEVCLNYPCGLGRLAALTWHVVGQSKMVFVLSVCGLLIVFFIFSFAEDGVPLNGQPVQNLQLRQISQQKVHFLLLVQVDMQAVEHRHCHQRLYG